MLNQIFAVKRISIFTAIIFITISVAFSATAESISGNVSDPTGKFVQHGNVRIIAWSHSYQQDYDAYVDSATGDYEVGVDGDSGYHMYVADLATGYWGATTMAGFEDQPAYEVYVGLGEDLFGHDFEIREDHISPIIDDVVVEGTSTGDPPKAGEDIVISAIVTDGGGSTILESVIRARRAGEAEWPDDGEFSFALDIDGRWRGNIPSWLVTTAGVEYLIDVCDWAFNYTQHPSDGWDNPEFIAVEPPDAIISGIITDDSSGAPLEGVWVKAWSDDLQKDAYDITDENGEYILEVAAGTWTIKDARLKEYYPVDPPRRNPGDPFDFIPLYEDILVPPNVTDKNVKMALDETPPEINILDVGTTGILPQNGGIVEVEVRDDESGVYDGNAWFRWRYLGDWEFNENQLHDEEDSARDNIFKGGVDFDRTGIIEYFIEAWNTADAYGTEPSPRPDDKPNGQNHGYYALVIFQNPASKAIYYDDSSTFNGEFIAVGTIISAANPHGVFCGGLIVTKPGLYIMEIYGNGDEGMQDGETPNFFIFDEANRKNARVRYLNGDDATWHQDVWAEVNLEGYNAKRKLISLEQNWNLIGLSGEPNDGDTSVESVLRSIEGEYDLVIGYDETGALIHDTNPSTMAFNTLTEIDDVYGFYLLMNNPAILDVDVAITPPQKPIDMSLGLNLVSYLPEDERDVEIALGLIGGLYNWVRGFAPRIGGVQFYEPDNPNFSTLKEMKQPFGYFINMTQEAQLIYNPSIAAPSFSVAAKPKMRRGSKALSNTVMRDVIPTTSMVFFYGDATINGRPAPKGTRVLAYDTDDIKVGQFVVCQTGKFGFMPVYHDETFTPDVDEGANTGDAIKFFINGRPAVADGKATWTTFGDRIKVNLSVGGLAEKTIPQKFALWRNYPNPFNPETWIPYQLAQSADVTINIYNVRGQVIRELKLGQQPAGAYLSQKRAAHWDGRNERGELVSSGVYFYSIRAGDFKATRKFVILK